MWVFQLDRQDARLTEEMAAALKDEPVAVRAVRAKPACHVYAAMEGETPVGAMSIRFDEQGVKIANIGVVRKRHGYGAMLVALAHAFGKPVWLKATPTACAFYEAVGFARGETLEDGRVIYRMEAKSG
jgi:hypothetical protein